MLRLGYGLSLTRDFYGPFLKSPVVASLSREILRRDPRRQEIDRDCIASRGPALCSMCPEVSLEFLKHF